MSSKLLILSGLFQTAFQSSVVTTSNGQDFKLTYNYDKSKLKFEAVVGAGKWFAVGFGKTMIDSDMIIFSTENQGSVIDAWSTSYSAPSPDAVSHLEDIQITITNGIYTFTCYRDLNTGDAEDYAFTLDSI
jgi:hypothetical protein